MKCMCAQTRPRFILSSEGVLGGMEFEPMLTPREKSTLPERRFMMVSWIVPGCWCCVWTCLCLSLCTDMGSFCLVMWGGLVTDHCIRFVHLLPGVHRHTFGIRSRRAFVLEQKTVCVSWVLLCAEVVLFVAHRPSNTCICSNNCWCCHT